MKSRFAKLTCGVTSVLKIVLVTCVAPRNEELMSTLLVLFMNFQSIPSSSSFVRLTSKNTVSIFTSRLLKLAGSFWMSTLPPPPPPGPVVVMLAPGCPFPLS